jgi:hypothetical protein
MKQFLKQLLTPLTPLELAARELIEAQRSKLEAETALDYASHMVMYHDARINRLSDRLGELKEQA